MPRIITTILSILLAAALCQCSRIQNRMKEATASLSETDSAMTAIHPSSLNPEQIRTDLIGRTITGVDTGFITRNTQITLSEENLQAVEITGQTDTDGVMTIDADLSIKSDGDGAFIGHVRLEYREEDSGWRLIMVQSQGLEFVRTGRYLSCITYTRNTLEGEESVTLLNSSDHDLAVGGYYWDSDNNRKKFCVTVPANGSQVLGNWFMLRVTDVELEFAELP